MSELLNFLLAAAIILTVAKASGYISVRLGQPSVLGELLVGVILGPTVLNLLNVLPWFASDPTLSDSITLFADIGVILLMFLAGLELELQELLRTGKVASVAGTLGVMVPLIAGFITARLFGMGTAESVFIGLSLSATSVSISAQTLMELGVLRSKVGLALLGAAVFDDVLVVLLLSVSSIVWSAGLAESGGIGTILIQMVIFLVAITGIGLFILPAALRRVSELPISQAITAFSLVICFIFAWMSEALGGVAAITGAFMAGLFLARTSFVNEIEQGVSAIAYGFFVPVFLVNIGLQANLRAIDGSLWLFALVLTLVAILTKVIGSGGGALLSGFNRRDSLRLGIGMISRGEVGLIVASVSLSRGILQPESFSVVVFMIIVATLVTPMLLRHAYQERIPRVTKPAPGDIDEPKTEVNATPKEG